jgi:hypothetical protein
LWHFTSPPSSARRMIWLSGKDAFFMMPWPAKASALFDDNDLATLVIAAVGTDKMWKLCHAALWAKRAWRNGNFAVSAPTRMRNGSAALTLGDCHI